MTAKNRFEKTQNAALGNFPDGTCSVGSNSVVMINSCMYPHVKYDNCNPMKHIASLKACLKNSGLLLKYLTKKSSYAELDDEFIDALVGPSDSPINGTVSLKSR